jgi:hypothetical protein
MAEASSSSDVTLRGDVPYKSDYTLKKRPWRRYVTPWETIIQHKYEGEGTEEKPYIVTWVAGRDEENPMTWADGYKWVVCISVAIATLAVSMASSTLYVSPHIKPLPSE